MSLTDWVVPKSLLDTANAVAGTCKCGHCEQNRDAVLAVALRWMAEHNEHQAAETRRVRKRCIDEFKMCRDASLMDQSGIGFDVQVEYARIVGKVIDEIHPEKETAI